MDENEKLDLFIKVSFEFGLIVDVFYFLIFGFDDNVVVILLDNVLMLFKYMKFRDVLYLVCSWMVLLMDM